MYQLVLAAALATSATTPNHCFRNHCHGYGGYSGYAGYAWSGCHGCHAYGGPIGYGCAGGCYGYHGGCYGGWGVFTGEAFPYAGCTGCYGAYYGYAGYGVPIPIPAGPGAQRPPVRDPFPPINPDTDKKQPGEETPLPKEKKKTGGLEEQTRASIKIDVPEGAKLFVDGQHINVPAGERTFKTPILTRGETYFYDIRIEIARNGETIREERRVVINAGQEVAVSFPSLPATGTQTARTNR